MELNGRREPGAIVKIFYNRLILHIILHIHKGICCDPLAIIPQKGVELIAINVIGDLRKN